MATIFCPKGNKNIDYNRMSSNFRSAIKKNLAKKIKLFFAFENIVVHLLHKSLTKQLQSYR
jgi:hypothetical protein